MCHLVDNNMTVRRSTWVPIPQHSKPHQDHSKFNTVPNRCHDGSMRKWLDSPLCKEPICINAFGIKDSALANSFDNVIMAMDTLTKIGMLKRTLLEKTIVMAVGLGHCDTLYKGNFMQYLLYVYAIYMFKP